MRLRGLEKKLSEEKDAGKSKQIRIVLAFISFVVCLLIIKTVNIL